MYCYAFDGPLVAWLLICYYYFVVIFSSIYNVQYKDTRFSIRVYDTRLQERLTVLFCLIDIPNIREDRVFNSLLRYFLPLTFQIL